MRYLFFYIYIITTLINPILASKKEHIHFNYNEKELVDIIHELAAKKEVNIVFPVGSQAITSKVTIHIEKPISLDEAWNQLYTLIDLAGYTLINKDALYTIVKSGKETSKEPLPIYVGVIPEKLPDSDKRIRYLYYLSNLKVSEQIDNTELGAILKEVLPDTAVYKPDPVTNGLLIIDKANNIRGVMEIITKLDNANYQEKLEIIKLRYTDAKMIAKLFNEDILKLGEAGKYRFDPKKQPSESTYFPKNIKIIPESRTNSLIILGKQSAIDRVRDFILKYIDVELESGKSILHIYQLQYMDANKIADVLRKVIDSTKQDSSGQSKGDVVSNIKATERIFGEVIIQTDKPTSASDKSDYFGNNNLIIAARNDDWEHIKNLIEQLDQAQPQAIIEVLIANLTNEDTKSLGALARNPLELPMPNGVNIQSAQIGNGIVLDPEPTTLASDLMQEQFDGSGSDIGNVASNTRPGSTVLSINDKETGHSWGVVQLLKLFSYTKVISHPHLIATNNTQATVKIGQSRLLNDQTAGSGGGTTIVKKKNINAELIVDIKPRIYTSETPGGKEDLVNLQVTVDVTDFLPGDSQNSRLTRYVTTNAILKNGQILALGGLLNLNLEDGANEVPILSKIPLLGWLAKSRTGLTTNTNLTVFIAVTIIEPRLRSGVGSYTTDYADIAKKYSKEGSSFDTLKDPITRWYFKRDHNTNNAINEFITKDEFKQIPIRTFIDTEMSEASINNAAVATHEEKTIKKPKRIVLSNVKPSEEIEKNESNNTSEKASLQDIVSTYEDTSIQALPADTETALALDKSTPTTRTINLETLLEQEENPLL